jgi:hypothetical protein
MGAGAIGAVAIAALVALSCGPREEVRRTAYADGHPWTELHYRAGKAEGPFTTWYRNGQKANAGGNLAGRLHGQVTEWHEDGTVVLEANYDRGYLDGPWREHWPDGKDRCTANYQKGRLEGQPGRQAHRRIDDPRSSSIQITTLPRRDYQEVISTRRFWGSRTPSAVGTRLSFSP